MINELSAGFKHRLMKQLKTKGKQDGLIGTLNNDPDKIAKADKRLKKVKDYEDEMDIKKLKEDQEIVSEDLPFINSMVQNDPRKEQLVKSRLYYAKRHNVHANLNDILTSVIHQ